MPSSVGEEEHVDNQKYEAAHHKAVHPVGLQVVDAQKGVADKEALVFEDLAHIEGHNSLDHTWPKQYTPTQKKQKSRRR